jgi:hypothetical protein
MGRQAAVCWAALAVVLIVLLAIVLAAGRQVILTPGARALFVRWMEAHPRAREREQWCSGVRDVTREPERFFGVELEEREHADVAQAVRAAGGVLDEAWMQRWIDENTDEVYRRGITTCG